MRRMRYRSISIPEYVWNLAKKKAKGMYIKPSTICVKGIKREFTQTELDNAYLEYHQEGQEGTTQPVPDGNGRQPTAAQQVTAENLGVTIDEINESGNAVIYDGEENIKHLIAEDGTEMDDESNNDF